jgi:hypothetical protein
MGDWIARLKYAPQTLSVPYFLFFPLFFFSLHMLHPVYPDSTVRCEGITDMRLMGWDDSYSRHNNLSN